MKRYSRSFRSLWAGEIVSEFGGAAGAIVNGLLLYELTGSREWMGVLWLVYFIPSLVLQGISAFFAGLGSGWISPAFSQVVSQSMASGLRDKGNTWINTGTSFGIIFTGLIALLFSEEWRWSYMLFAVLAFIVCWWNALALKEEKQQPLPPAQNFLGMKLLKKARFLIAASIGIGFSSSIYWTFSRSYVTEIYSLSENESVIFWIVMGGAGILGGIAGTVIQSIGLRLSYRLGLLVITASILGLTLSHLAAIYLSALLFGTSFIFMTGLFIVWGTRQFPETPSLGVSMSFFSLGIGQSLGSFIAGLLIEEISYPFAFVFFGVAGFLFLFCKVRIVSSSANPSK